MALAGKQDIFTVRLKDGSELWRHPWKTQYDVNAADPIVSGTTMYIGSGYGHGCAALDMSSTPPKVVWENKNLRTHTSPAVLIGGYRYGADDDCYKADATTSQQRFAQQGARVDYIQVGQTPAKRQLGLDGLPNRIAVPGLRGFVQSVPQVEVVPIHPQLIDPGAAFWQLPDQSGRYVEIAERGFQRLEVERDGGLIILQFVARRRG